MTHELKTWPGYFEEIFMGHKTFEIRKNDRNFKTSKKIYKYADNHDSFDGWSRKFCQHGQIC